MLYKVIGMGWFIVDAPTKRKAYSAGVEEFGRGGVDDVIRSNEEEATYFKSIKGEDAIEVIPSLLDS